ncbi:oxidoreductase [Spirochaetia bacterium]|nr:oxidoreductase [Spirochaetia bacterium]
MDKIPVAIIGLGRIASLLEDDALREKPCTHAGAIAANPNCTIAAGCDLDADRRRIFAERWHRPVYADVNALFAEHKPGILTIATHPDSHYYYCALAARHEVPVVVCEKPLADTIAAARKIAALHRKGITRILTNHERRYSADYIKAKAILEEKRLGPLLSIRAALYMGKTRRLLDVFWHDGTHLADAAMFLTGASLYHRRRWGARLDSRTGTAWLEGYLERPAERVPFLMEIGAERDHLVFELEFSCAQGRLRIGNGIFEVWESAESSYAEGFRSLKKTGDTFDGPTGYFANMVEDAVACYRDPSRQPRSGAADGLRVIEYLNSVKAWRGGMFS